MRQPRSALLFLRGWWPGDRTAVDIQGTNDGVLFGSATFAPGQVGQAFRFDGVDDFVDSQNQVGITGTGVRSIEFWVNIPDDASSEFGYIPVGYGAVSTDVHSRVRDRVAVALST